MGFNDGSSISVTFLYVLTSSNIVQSTWANLAVLEARATCIFCNMILCGELCGGHVCCTEVESHG